MTLFIIMVVVYMFLRTISAKNIIMIVLIAGDSNTIQVAVIAME